MNIKMVTIPSLFGGVLPRYIYWLKGSNNKDIPVECLAFDREQERFNNAETDHVQRFFPKLNALGLIQLTVLTPKMAKLKYLT